MIQITGLCSIYIRVTIFWNVESFDQIDKSSVFDRGDRVFFGVGI